MGLGSPSDVAFTLTAPKRPASSGAATAVFLFLCLRRSCSAHLLPGANMRRRPGSPPGRGYGYRGYYYGKRDAEAQPEPGHHGHHYKGRGYGYRGYYYGKRDAEAQPEPGHHGHHYKG